MSDRNDIHAPNAVDHFLGVRIASLRKRNCRSIQDLARALEIGEEELRQMEAGLMRITSIHIAKIAQALDVPIAEVFAHHDNIRRDVFLLEDVPAFLKALIDQIRANEDRKAN